MNRFENVGMWLDRNHWPPDAFTCFEGFTQLKDCSGSHGNKTGCSPEDPEAAARKVAMQRKNKVRFLAARSEAYSSSWTKEELEAFQSGGVKSTSFSILGSLVRCGPACIQVKVQVGDHNSCGQ
mmetsp:Transcript_45562/g.71388  ORF Transcript_45562/g.71388 Transcript_45562/m.71388 type:complete len:124 (-) Transcript_45562:805-1176(-)